MPACYFMHPVKGRAVIGTSSRVYNIDKYVIDHPKELEKILDETDGGEGLTIFVRITTPPVEGTLYHLAAKFGAEVDEAAAMLKEAKSRGCQVGHRLPCRLAVPEPGGLRQRHRPRRHGGGEGEGRHCTRSMSAAASRPSMSAPTCRRSRTT